MDFSKLAEGLAGGNISDALGNLAAEELKQHQGEIEDKVKEMLHLGGDAAPAENKEDSSSDDSSNADNSADANN